MDESERDKFYGAPQPADGARAADDDDGEYELDEPDQEAEERRRQAIVAARPPRIDVDELYREADRDFGGEILESWVRGFRLRFEHLCIAPAILVIAVALIKLKLFWTALIVSFMLAVGALYFYLNVQERRRQVELDQKREELYAKRRQHFSANAAGAEPTAMAASPPATTIAAPQPAAKSDDSGSKERPPIAGRPLPFQFSLRSMLLTTTFVAFALGIMRWFGGPERTASVLGCIALAGLIVDAVGVRPPQVVMLAWWLTLIMYLVMCTFALTTGTFS